MPLVKKDVLNNNMVADHIDKVIKIYNVKTKLWDKDNSFNG